MDGEPAQDGYPAFYVPRAVTAFQGYGMGSRSHFNQGAAIHNAMAFQAPGASGVQFYDILTVFLSGSGGINSVINGTGRRSTPASAAERHGDLFVRRWTGAVRASQ